MSERRPRILLADDHPLMLEGLRKLLAPNFRVVGAVTNGRTLLEAAAARRPDLVITDVRMPGLDGIEATRRLQETEPGVRVPVLSIHAEPSCVRAPFAAGAWGYLLKTSAPEEIERAVREVLADRFYVSPAVARSALAGEVYKPDSSPQAAGEVLTARELQILRL